MAVAQRPRLCGKARDAGNSQGQRNGISFLILRKRLNWREKMLKRLQIIFLWGALSLLSSRLTSAEVWWPDPVHPAPRKEWSPQWLLSHKLCFSRWDGGRIETCKGFLSGWVYFNPPWPDVIEATTNWYKPATV